MPDYESTLVPLAQHNQLTAGPAKWTSTRVPSDVFHAARSVYGTCNEDDDKRVYRTLQAALCQLAEPAAVKPEALYWLHPDQRKAAAETLNR